VGFSFFRHIHHARPALGIEMREFLGHEIAGAG
jgi:hypothetical protein